VEGDKSAGSTGSPSFTGLSGRRVARSRQVLDRGRVSDLQRILALHSGFPGWRMTTTEATTRDVSVD